MTAAAIAGGSTALVTAMVSAASLAVPDPIVEDHWHRQTRLHRPADH